MDSRIVHGNPKKWIKGEGAWHLFRRLAANPENHGHLNVISSWLEYISGSHSLEVQKYRQQRLELDDNAEAGAVASDDNVASLSYVIKLTERVTDMDLSPSEVGVGVSQVVPFIASLTVDPEMLEHEYGVSVITTLPLRSIEQPELHLHPAMQVRLGELIIQHARRHSQFMKSVDLQWSQSETPVSYTHLTLPTICSV